ncbi:hypothetical protein C8Q76DRAFT_746197 [Earliella scabrosa]|nr:hypothetical protein C8Q76DRAFT_746197 [Earliella scabrosa]
MTMRRSEAGARSGIEAQRTPSSLELSTDSITDHAQLQLRSLGQPPPTRSSFLLVCRPPPAIDASPSPTRRTAHIATRDALCAARPRQPAATACTVPSSLQSVGRSAHPSSAIGPCHAASIKHQLYSLHEIHRQQNEKCTPH